jgi:hypothetical protein
VHEPAVSQPQAHRADAADHPVRAERLDWRAASLLGPASGALPQRRRAATPEPGRPTDRLLSGPIGLRHRRCHAVSR